MSDAPRPTSRKVYWLSDPPKTCNACGTPFKPTDHFVDGKVKPLFPGHGSHWAIMCLPCHRQFGMGLGTGLGQRFSLSTLEKVEG